MNLAEKLTIQRKKSGMSQEQFADRLGITRQSVSKWEGGSSIPEISKLVTMSEIFQVSLDYLLKDYLDEESGGFPARKKLPGEEEIDAVQKVAEESSREWSEENLRSACLHLARRQLESIVRALPHWEKRLQ